MDLTKEILEFCKDTELICKECTEKQQLRCEVAGTCMFWELKEFFRKVVNAN